MSPRHFSKIWGGNYRQSQREKEVEQKVEHAVSFAFSPVFHPVKTVRDIKRFFKRGQRQSES
jgi:hypothetical protein